MKKILILVSLLLIFPLISAAQINMNSNFSQGQTLIAQVSGNFINQIQQQNILLYNNQVRVSFIPTVQKIDDGFYLYGQLGKIPGNYSLEITGVGYMEGTQISHDNIIQNFTITNDTADFSVNPGFIQTDQNFSINVQDLSDNPITIDYFLGNLTSQSSSGDFFSSLFGGSAAASQQGQSITLNSGEIEPVYFEINNSNQDQFIYATLSTNNTQYQIPVFIPAASSQVLNASSLNSSFQIQPSEANISMSTNASTYRYIYLYNSGQQNLTNISISVSDNLIPYISVQNQTLDLANNSNVSVQINITSGSNEGVINGQVIASSGNLTSYMNLSLNFSNSYIASQNDTLQFQTCSQLNGTICNNNETCSGGQTQNALDGVCCLSACLSSAQSNSTLEIIGWTIASVIVLLLIIFLIRRYMKAKRPLNLLEIAKKR